MNMDMELKVVQGLRPCYVKHGLQKKAAMFHQWENVSYPVREELFIGGMPSGIVSHTLAIVEYENGEVCKEQPENIIFTDSKEYAFPREEKEDETD